MKNTGLSRLFLSVSLLFLLMSSVALAYDPPEIPITSAPLGSFSGGTFDTVNLANLNVHFEIPVFQKAGKGQNFSYNLAFNSLVWSTVPYYNTRAWVPMKTWGWPTLRVAAMGYVTRGAVGSNYSNFAYVEPNGGGHMFPGADCSNACGAFQPPILTNDNSGFRITAYSPSTGLATIVNRSGIVLNVPAVDPGDGGYSYGGSLVDPNGNTITAGWSSNQYIYTDATGAQVLTLSPHGGLGDDDAGSPLTLTYTAPNQNPASVTVTYLAHTIKTNFQVCDVYHDCYAEFQDYPWNYPYPHYLVDKVTLPDGTYYQLGYEQTDGYPGATTGRITSVRLPTGASITYSYNGTNCYNNNNCITWDGTVTSMFRTLGGQTWHYTHGQQPGQQWPWELAQSTTTMIDPAGNETDLNFSQSNGPPYETVRTVYKGPASQGNVLDYAYTCYNGNHSDSTCPTAVVNAGSGITRTARIDHLNRISFTSLASNIQQLFDQYGNVTEEDDYDYGSPGSQPLLRKSTFAFNGSLCASPIYICDRTAASVLQDAHGAQAGRMDYVYDGGGNTKGNLTKTTRWVGNGIAPLVRQFAYNTGQYGGGTLASVTDYNGAVTTFTYGWYVCGDAFPQSMVQPSQFTGSLTTQFTYNCGGGVLTSTRDPNGAVTRTNYGNDPWFWRPDSKTDAAGNTTAYNYYGVSNFWAGSGVGIGQVEAGMIWNNGNSASDTVTTHDTLGRVSLTQTREAPRGKPNGDSFDTVERDYDGLGNVSKVSQPFKCGLGQGLSQCSAPVTTTTYDALNRAVLTTDSAGRTTTYSYELNDVEITVAGGQSFSRQIEKDALGRLTSVCEISSGLQGVGDCGQQRHQTGYRTAYTHDALGNLASVTQGAQTRSFSYDGLSRMLSETNPENGTTSYTYDSDPTETCTGVFAGDQVRRYDQAGDNTCYTWDNIHRLTAVTYKGPGGNAAHSAQKYFTYDVANPGQGITATNPVGRPVYAYSYPVSASGWGNLVSVNSGKCADVVNVSQADGALVQQYTCLGSGQYNQRWILSPVGVNLYQIISENSGKCLDVRGVSRQDGAPIQQYDCLGPNQTNQVWSLVHQSRGYQVISENSGKCLDVTGVSQSNGALLQQYTCLGGGQLNQIWTFSGITGAPVNWTGFGYDSRGTPTDLYQSSDNGNGAYHTQNGIAPSGTVSSRTGYFWDNVAGRNTARFANAFTYSFDGKGRYVGLTDTTTGDQIWNPSYYPTHYNAADQPDELGFYPSADDEKFTWDPNSGRMTNWQSDLNPIARSQYGSLTWNANGTLQQMAINDTANPGNSQTCHYGYDDLARLTSANCGSVWNQSFSHDQWGNIWKTGSVSFQPTSYTNNRINLSGFSYDGMGNVATDGYHTYTYDAEERAVMIDTKTFQFDAFNRVVERNNPSGSVTDIIYAPDGYNFSFMNGTTPYYTVPLIQGIQAVYADKSPAPMDHMRHSDWLGSARMEDTRSGTVYYDGAYAPFGEPYAETGQADRSFTGQQMMNSGLYEFPLRQHSVNQGRWMVPDPGGLIAADLASPQTWNRYAYGENNPLVNKDSLGLCDGCDDGSDWSFWDWYFPPVFDVNLFYFGSAPSLTTDPGLSSDPNGLYGGFPTLLAYYTFGAPSAGTWASAAFVANTFAGATLGVVGGVFVGAEIGAGSLGLYGPAANRAFWSGGLALARGSLPISAWKATQWAMSTEGTTLGMTPIGRVASIFGHWVPDSWWESMSEHYAQGAEGPVMFFEGPALRLGNTWMDVEFKVLNGKGNPIYQVPVGWPGQ